MKSKPIKRPEKELETIPKLKKEITTLKNEIDKLKVKIIKQDTTILTIKNQKAKAEYRFTVLQSQYNKLKETKGPVHITIKGLDDPVLKANAEEINKKNR